MFFLLSKLFDFLMAPVSWLVILIIFMIFSKSKKIKKRLRISIVCILLIFSNHFIYRTIVVAWQPKPATLDKGIHYSAGILLGGFVVFDVNKNGYFNDAADRFIETVKLYHQGFIQKIVMTGGSGLLVHNEAKEADFVKNELMANGISEKDIIIEASSRNTFENAIFTKKILDSLNLKPPYLLITSATHMPRSIQIFKRANIKVDQYPCAYDVVYSHLSVVELLLPDLKLFTSWYKIIHEIVGLKIYQLTGKA